MTEIMKNAILLAGTLCALIALGGSQNGDEGDYLSPLALVADKEGKTL